MDFQKHFGQTWKIFADNIVSLLIVTLVYLVVSAITFGIMMPVMTAGYMQSLLLLIREERVPEVRDLFSEMNLFFPLLAFTVIVGVIATVGLLLLVLPGLAVIIGVSFFCLYMLPLMTDQKKGIVDAVKESYRMVLQPPMSEHVAVVGVALIISSIGGSVAFGLLLTQPFVTLFILSVYEGKHNSMLPPPAGD